MTAPTMARVPASAISVILRLTERGDAGVAGAITSGPSTIERENNRLSLNFIAPIRLNPSYSKTPASAELHLRHGYRPLGTSFGSPLWRGSRSGSPVLWYADVKREAIMVERLSAEARKSALQGLSGWSELAGRRASGRTFGLKD